MNVWWVLTRVGGLTAWVLMAGSVISGLLLSSRLSDWQTRVLRSSHDWLSGTGVAFVALHVLSLVPEGHVNMSWVDILVPFASPWKPFGIGLGIIALMLLVAVEITSLLRTHLSNRVWKGIHFSSFAMFWGATAHMALVGTDVWHPGIVTVVDLTVLAVFAMTLYRIIAGRRRKQRRQPPATHRQRTPSAAASR
jgi:DMSO/TMAO reductase YedYZ heme-binding membrane subunit